MNKTLLEEDKITAPIRQISSRSFTLLDFSEVLKTMCPVDGQRLVARFGQFGEKRRFTVTTYLSSQLDVYSPKPDSHLRPLTRNTTASFKDYRTASAQERQRFGSPRMAIFKKKERIRA